MITYKKMSVFDAPIDCILVHACNGQGVWGSGIAKSFKDKFPLSFISYRDFCLNSFNVDYDLGAIGKAYLCKMERDKYVGCLITSLDYAEHKDNPNQIIAQTYLALHDFCEQFKDRGFQYTPVFSNKFNSGLFNVPWEETEKVLRYFTERYSINWIVCDPEM